MERESSRRFSDSSGLRRASTFNIRRRLSDHTPAGGPLSSRADYVRHPNGNHGVSPTSGFQKDPTIRRDPTEQYQVIAGSPGHRQPIIMSKHPPPPPGYHSELEADRAMIQKVRRSSGPQVGIGSGSKPQQGPGSTSDLPRTVNVSSSNGQTSSSPRVEAAGLQRRASAPVGGLTRRSSAPVGGIRTAITGRLPRVKLIVDPRRYSECSSTSSRCELDAPGVNVCSSSRRHSETYYCGVTDGHAVIKHRSSVHNGSGTDIYKVPPVQVQSIDEWTNAEDDKGSLERRRKKGGTFRDRHLDSPRSGSPYSDRHRLHPEDASSHREHHKNRMRDKSPREEHRHRDTSPHTEQYGNRQRDKSPRGDYHGDRPRDYSPPREMYSNDRRDKSPRGDHYSNRHRDGSPYREQPSNRHREDSPPWENYGNRQRDISPNRNRYNDYLRGERASPRTDRYGHPARDGSPYGEPPQRHATERLAYNRDRYQDDQQQANTENGRSSGVVLRPKQEKTDKSKSVKARKSFIDRLFGPKQKDKESKKEKKKGKAPILEEERENQEMKLGYGEYDSEGRSDHDITEDEAGDSKENLPPHSASSTEEGARAMTFPDHSDEESLRDNNNGSLTEDDWKKLIDDVENDMAFPDPPEPEVDYHDEDNENDAPNGSQQINQPALGSLDDLPKHLKPATSTENLVEPKKLHNPVVSSKLHQDLHREMESNKRMGVNVLLKKTELKKEFERREETKKKKEREEYEKQKKTEIQKRLEEQKQKFDEREKPEKEKGPSEKQDESTMSEFQRMRSKIYSNKAS